MLEAEQHMRKRAEGGQLSHSLSRAGTHPNPNPNPSPKPNPNPNPNSNPNPNPNPNLRAAPEQVGCPWGKCQLSGPQAGKFKLLSVTSC